MDRDTTLPDVAWRKIILRSNLLAQIDQQGYAQISAEELKTYSDRTEPRLMAKLDSALDRPNVFVENGLNVLPIRHGEYVVFKDSENICYCHIPSVEKDQQFSEYRPTYDIHCLDSLSKPFCSGESEAIDLCYLSSLLTSFCKTQDLVLTRRGRLRASHIAVQLPCNVLLNSQGVQIEIDAVFESSELIVLIEAKMQFVDSFHIRQLFYPYHWLRQRTNKPIRAILLCCSNGKFRLAEYEIPNQFGPLTEIRREYFVIGENPILSISLSSFLNQLHLPTEDLTIPFPQADDVDKIVDTVHHIWQGATRVADLVNNFDFVERQAQYYFNAAKYLGFVEENDPPALSQIGTRLIQEPSRINRTESILRQMLIRPVLREAIQLLEKLDFEPDRAARSEIEVLLKKHRPELSGDTLSRRAKTVIAWLRWLVANCKFKRQY